MGQTEEEQGELGPNLGSRSFSSKVNVGKPWTEALDRGLTLGMAALCLQAQRPHATVVSEGHSPPPL